MTRLRLRGKKKERIPEIVETVQNCSRETKTDLNFFCKTYEEYADHISEKLHQEENLVNQSKLTALIGAGARIIEMNNPLNFFPVYARKTFATESIMRHKVHYKGKTFYTYSEGQFFPEIESHKADPNKWSRR